jgi:hypothetical protein
MGRENRGGKEKRGWGEEDVFVWLLWFCRLLLLRLPTLVHGLAFGLSLGIGMGIHISLRFVMRNLACCNEVMYLIPEDMVTGRFVVLCLWEGIHMYSMEWDGHGGGVAPWGAMKGNVMDIAI